MNRFLHLFRKGTWLSAAFLLCMLAGCGYQGAAAAQSSSSQKSAGSCPAEGETQSVSTSNVVYTVSWDAVAKDADSNQGTSALHISALDVKSGKVLWQKAPAKISAMYQSSLQQVVDGVLYIAGQGSQNMLVLAVDTRDGHVIWQAEEKQGGMSICAGKIFLEIGGTQLLALRVSDGKKLWSYTSKDAQLSNSIATSQAVYILEQKQDGPTGVRSSVIVLSADSGKVLRNRPYGTQQYGTLQLVTNGQKVYVINQVPVYASTDPMVPISSVQALDGKSGEVLWTAQMPPNMEQIRVLRAGQIVYLNGQNLANQYQSILVALNASTGKQLWQRKHSYNQLTVLDQQDLYGYQGYSPNDDPQGKKSLCALDSTTGKERWCVDNLQPSLFSLSVTQDTVIVEETLQPDPLTLVQNIYGVDRQSGKILWKLPWKGSSSSVVTVTLVTVADQQVSTSIIA